MQSRHRSGLQVAMSLNHSLIAVSKGTFCKLHQKQRNKSFYSILMMKTAFMFFGRVSDPTLAPSLSGSINLKNDDDGRSRSWKTDPMPEFAELIETLVGFVPAPTLTLEFRHQSFNLCFQFTVSKAMSMHHQWSPPSDFDLRPKLFSFPKVALFLFFSPFSRLPLWLLWRMPEWWWWWWWWCTHEDLRMPVV